MLVDGVEGESNLFEVLDDHLELKGGSVIRVVDLIVVDHHQVPHVPFIERYQIQALLVADVLSFVH